MNSVKGFTFYRSYYEYIKELEEEDRKELLEAIVFYMFEDVEPTLSKYNSLAWKLIKPNLNTSKNRSLNPQKQNENKEKTNKKQNKNKTKTNEKQLENNDLYDKDKDKDKDKEIDKEIDKDNKLLLQQQQDLYTFIEENYGRPLSPLEYEKINEWQEDYSEELIRCAVSKSVMMNKKTFSYTNGILKNWKSCGYRTLKEIEDEERKPKESPMELFDYDWLNDYNLD